MAKEPTKARLTDKLLRSLKTPSKGYIWCTDTHTSGLMIRLYHTGRASWFLRYTNPRRKVQSAKLLGDYPAMTLADARAAATLFRADLLQGKVSGANKIETIKDLISDYHTRRGDAVGLLDRLSDKGLGAQVNRVHAALHGALSWAVNSGLIEINPMAGLKRRVKEKPRDRVLSDTELRAVWEATAARSAPSREFVQMLILSMQRRDECRAMQWDELDQDAGLWTIPSSRTKAGRAHIVPLPTFAWEILESIPRLGPYVFTIDGKRPYAGHSKIVGALTSESGVSDWVLHDLRRTGRTGLSRLGVPVLVSELILNHARNDLERTYDLHAFTDEKRDALEKWGEHVRRVVLNSEVGAKVVSIR